MIRPTICAMMLALPVTGLAQVPTDFPRVVQKAAASLDTDCRGYRGRPGNSRSLVKTADLNGDGIRDYVFDLNNYVCNGAEAAMGSGQSGAVITIYVGGPTNSAIQVFQATVHASKIETTAGKSRLFVDVAGVDCGQANAARIPLSRRRYCSRELLWDAAKQSFAFAPLSRKRIIQ